MKRLVVHCDTGLGNRYRALSSALRLAAMMPDRKLVYVWPVTDHLRCEFADLFLPIPGIEIVPALPSDLDGAEFVDGCNQRFPAVVNIDSPAKTIFSRTYNWVYSNRDMLDGGIILGQHGPRRMVNGLVRSELQSHLARLKPTEPISATVEEFARNFFPISGKTIGVHIRHGDNVWCNSFVDDHWFVRFVERHFWGIRRKAIFLATDEPESERLMRHRFPNEVVIYPKRHWDRSQSAAACINALIELLLLSRTTALVRSSASTYSQIAAWLGNMPTHEIGPLEHHW